MPLRYFQTYDKDGIESKEYLQQWNDEDQCWTNVNLIRCQEKDEITYINDPDAYY